MPTLVGVVTARAQQVTAPAGATPAAAPVATTPAVARGGTAEATDSPRERGRVLQKRNPIASEYLAPGSLGRSPGASADGEGNDFRGFFPATGGRVGTSAATSLGGFLVYQEQSGVAEPGFEMRSGWRGGATGGRWAVDVRANVTAAERLIEHYESAWATRAPLAGEGTREIYFLERPRISQDVIATRTRTGGLHVEREWGAGHTSFAAVAWSDFDDDFYRNRIELNLGRGALVAGSAEVAPGATTQVAGDYAGGGARRYFASTLTARDILR